MTEIKAEPLQEAAPEHPLENGIFVAWKKDCFRSRATARTLRVPIEFLGASSSSQLWRYLALMWHTWRLLSERRPSTIVCLNQPPMLPLVCTLWTMLRGGFVIQDFHSGALSKAQWRPFLPAYRWMTRRAPTTLVHNRADARVLASWGASTSVLLTLPAAEPTHVRRGSPLARPRFMFVCTFAPDEPIQAAIDGFAACPQADFWITGNYRKAGLDQHGMPPNVRLLGFVDYAEYERVMADSTAVITLSDRAHIMQMAVEEAITMGIPVLTNESPTLREALADAGVFVDLQASAIAAGVNSMLANLEHLSTAAQTARQRCWRNVNSELLALRNRRPELFV